MAISEQLRDQMREIKQRYPRGRSAVMPCLHVAQAAEGWVSPEVVGVVADELDMTHAEVTAVASFYTMYLRGPAGRSRVGVCTNSLCAILGGDEIWDALVDYVGVGHNETTADGEITLERIECQAACTHAPVMTVNWELLDNQTPRSACDLIDTIRAGEPVAATRGPRTIGSMALVGKSLAGVDDGLAADDVALDEQTLVGLRTAQSLGHVAPSPTSARKEG
jgi:NADH-quinone oxidoreductase subunit E